MTSLQQGDVSLFQTVDGGNISVTGGVTQMDSGLSGMAYLLLFGGNEDDDGLDDNNFIWWGNIDEVDSAKHYRSETQHLLQSLPATTGNLRRIEQAAIRDLDPFLSQNIATSVSVVVSLPGLNKIQIDIAINAEGEENIITFLENWKAEI